ncbi:MAG: MarR family transcriptional regulator [Clostridia bacterium]|nr:MarR family transcriptional regulator [Clostridia bacterium]
MDKFSSANIVFSKFASDYDALKRDLPIRPSEMSVLKIITKREGKHTPMMLASLLGVSKPMIAAHIAALEEKGYIYKESAEEDKRSFFVLPTDKAKKLVEESEKNLLSHLERLESGLGEYEFSLLVSLLEEAQKILEQ